jgi:hypothetical protein
MKQASLQGQRSQRLKQLLQRSAGFAACELMSIRYQRTVAEE